MCIYYYVRVLRHLTVKIKIPAVTKKILSVKYGLDGKSYIEYARNTWHIFPTSEGGDKYSAAYCSSIQYSIAKLRKQISATSGLEWTIVISLSTVTLLESRNKGVKVF